MAELLSIPFSTPRAAGGGNGAYADNGYTVDVFEAGSTVEVASGRGHLTGDGTNWVGFRGQTAYDWTAGTTLFATISFVGGTADTHLAAIGWQDGSATLSNHVGGFWIGDQLVNSVGNRRRQVSARSNNVSNGLESLIQFHELNDQQFRVAVMMTATGARLFAQGGEFSRFGCAMGSDDWHELRIRPTATANGVKWFIGCLRGQLYVDDVSVETGWAPPAAGRNWLLDAGNVWGGHMATLAHVQSGGSDVVVAGWQYGSDHLSTNVEIRANRRVGETGAWATTPTTVVPAINDGVWGMRGGVLWPVADNDLRYLYTVEKLDFTESYVKYRQSTDGGATWGTEQAVNLPGQTNGVLNSPHKITSGTYAGRWLVSHWITDKQYEYGPPITVASITRSGTQATLTGTGSLWITPSDGIRVTGCDQVEYNVALAAASDVGDTSLKYTVSGTPATPATGTTIRVEAVFTYRTVAISYSDDDGSTWITVGLPAVSGAYLGEPAIVQEPDGTLAYYARSSRGRTYRATSSDGGATWTTPRPLKNIPNPNSRVEARLSSDGRLYVVGNNSGGISNVFGAADGWPRNSAMLWILNRSLEIARAFPIADYGSFYNPQNITQAVTAQYPAVVEWPGSQYVHVLWSEMGRSPNTGTPYSGMQYRQIPRSELESELPDAGDVRRGVSYGDGTKTGTLRVKPKPLMILGR